MQKTKILVMYSKLLHFAGWKNIMASNPTFRNPFLRSTKPTTVYRWGLQLTQATNVRNPNVDGYHKDSGDGNLNVPGLFVALVFAGIIITWICCCTNRHCRNWGINCIRWFYGCCFFRLDCATTQDLETSIQRYSEYPPLTKEESLRDTRKNPFISKIMVYLANEIPEFFFSILPTGSLREGYGKLQPSSAILATDYDLMLIPDGVTAGTTFTEGSANQENPPTFITTLNEEIPKGFVWLSLNFLDLKHWKNLTLTRHVERKVGHYLSVIKMQQLLSQHIKEVVFTELDRDAELPTVEVNGPAITVKVQRKHTSFDTCANSCCPCCSGMERELTLFYCDFTLGVHHPQWPKKAENWFSRERREHWPPEDVVERIRNRGCHVVPKASVKDTLLKFNPAQPTLTAYDQAPHLEWRYSFSQPEIELADCIPDAAREAFLALKVVNKTHLHSNSDSIPNLSSYVLKSILLRITEQHSPEDWTKLGADDILRELLENLHQALTSGICPHFWIEDINLLEDLPKWRLVELATKVEQIQRNPNRFVADNWLELTRCLRMYCLYCGPRGKKKRKGKKCCRPRCLVPCSYKDIENRTCCPCPYDDINFEVY